MNLELSVVAAKLPLRRRDGSAGHTLVDVALYAWLNQWRWCLGTGGRVERKESRTVEGRRIQRTVLIHRQIMGFPPCEVDHRDRNRLNNQQANLRVATRPENGQNLSLAANNTSGYRGVTWDKGRQKWLATAMLDGKAYFLKRWETAEEADAACKAFRAVRMPFSEDAGVAV